MSEKEPRKTTRKSTTAAKEVVLTELGEIVEEKSKAVQVKEASSAPKKTAAKKTTATKKTAKKPVETIEETEKAAKETIIDAVEEVVEKLESVIVEPEVPETAPPAKKVPAKKSAERKSPIKKETVEEEKPEKITRSKIKVALYIQCNGKEVEQQIIIDRVKEDWIAHGNQLKDIKTISTYIKPEEHAIYYVINDIPNSGRIEF